MTLTVNRQCCLIFLYYEFIYWKNSCDFVAKQHPRHLKNCISFYYECYIKMLLNEHRVHLHEQKTCILYESTFLQM